MMFPTQQSNDLVFQDSSIFQDLVNLEEYLLADDQDLSTQAKNCSIAKPKDTKKRKRIPSSANCENNDGVSAENISKSKKILHREFEKHRRQEMAKLYALLRSLIPLEYVKGKRAVSDHMHEAVNYIKDMQKNIQELSLRLDMLRKLSTSGSIGAEDGTPKSNYSPNCVTVCPCRNGVEILISSGFEEGGLPLSRVIMELVRRRLNIVSCVSTRANKRFIHRIQTETMASNLKCIDLSRLKGRLINVIDSFLGF